MVFLGGAFAEAGMLIVVAGKKGSDHEIVQSPVGRPSFSLFFSSFPSHLPLHTITCLLSIVLLLSHEELLASSSTNVRSVHVVDENNKITDGWTNTQH